MTLPVLLTIVGTVAGVLAAVAALLQLRRTPSVTRKDLGRRRSIGTGPDSADTPVPGGAGQDPVVENSSIPRRADEDRGEDAAAERCRVVGTPVSYCLETFRDREAYLAQIVQWLADTAIRMVTVFGRRGIGKSALAAKVVEILASTDSECRGVANLSTRTGGALTIERIFFTCTELATPSARQALVTLWASGREPRDKLIELFEAMEQGRHVVVLDNIEDQLGDDGRPENPDLSIFLDAVFRAVRAPQVLVTTELPMALDPAVRRFEARLHLQDGLPVEDCVELLRELDRNGDAGLLEAPRPVLEQAARRVHCVPRALELIVGALADDRLTFPTLDEILTGFPAREDIVDQLAHRRYQQLDDECRMALGVLAVFRGPVSREPVEWVMRPLDPSIDPVRALSHLVHVHMVSADLRSKEFVLHPLDAQIAYAALPDDGPFGRRVLERRVAAWYRGNLSPPPWHAVDDVVNHRHAFEHLLRAGDYDQCALVLDEIGEFLIWQGSSREVLSMHLEIRDHLKDEAALLAHLVGYGFTRDRSGPLEEAIEPLQQAVALAKRIGDKLHLERALFCLGEVYRDLRRLQEAVEVLTQGASLAEEIGDYTQQAHTLLQLSLAFSYLGDVPAALEVADKLQLLASTNDEVLILAQVNNARSAAYVAARRWVEAARTAEEAVQGYETCGMPEVVGYARNVLGIALLAQGRIDEATGLLRLTSTHGADIQSPRTEGLCLYNLAWGHWVAGRYGAARDTAHNATGAFRRSGGADIAASQELANAAAAMINGDRKPAIEALTQAARASQGNSDLAPGEWLMAEASRLCDELR